MTAVVDFGNAASISLDAVRGGLARCSRPDADAEELGEALRQVAADPACALPRWYAQAGRRFGRAPLAAVEAVEAADAAVPVEVLVWTVDDAVRTLLLAADPRRQSEVLVDLYHRGDVAERRSVLRSLGVLGIRYCGSGRAPDVLIALLHDALRTNDPRLVAAAVGPFGARHLDQHTFRHAVLKCVHMGIPIGAVAGLGERTDPDLAWMVIAYAGELAAAGRPVPADVRRLSRLDAADPSFHTPAGRARPFPSRART